MARHVLDGARAKVWRAGKQIEALKRKIRRRQESLRLEAKIDLRQSQAHFQVPKRRVTAPPIWSLLVGEILHNLRGALDYVAYEGSCKWDDSQFPILDKWDKPNWRFTGTMERMSLEQSALVYWYQPDGGGDSDHWLVRLRDLSNQDKHRLLIDTLMTGTFPNPIEGEIEDLEWVGEMEWLNPDPTVEVKAGTTIMSRKFRRTGPDPKVIVNSGLPSYVEFAEGGPVESHLELMEAFVRRVVESFVPLF